MKISVIIPVKNPDFGLLERALESVYRQTFKDYEIIMINDGSDAAHSAELRRMADENPQIRLFETEPKGVSAARNLAAGKAEGDVITYLDSDDFLSPVCFEEAVNILENIDIDAVWGGTFYGTEQEIRARSDKNADFRALSFEELEKGLIRLDDARMHQTKAECIGEPYRFGQGCYINRGIAARFIRKAAVQDFPEGIRIYEDAIWNLEMLKSLKVSYAQTEWYYYLANEASVSNAFNPDIIKDIETPLERIRQLLDLENETEYSGYTRILMDSLRYVYKCLYGNPKWGAAAGERKALKAHIYNDEPWREIGTSKYKALAQARDKQKALLYRMKALLFVWKLR
ncbi:MAG: glycosyltransferase family 2 protein [Lachnospiraceae bacterium]|nr:glycosyltransferase family 2 protein [Lachnospiraceae bacterium]